MNGLFPDTVLTDLGNGDYFFQTFGYDEADMEGFVASGESIHCPQYERLQDANDQVNLIHFIRQKGSGRDIRLYIDLNIVNQALNLLKGEPVYGDLRYEKVRKATARTLAFAGLMGAHLMYGIGIIEYASHPKNTLSEANRRLSLIDRAVEIPGQFWHRLAMDPEFYIPVSKQLSTPKLPIAPNEMAGQFAFYDTYQALLKIAYIQISGLSGMKAYRAFMDWMVADHFFSAATAGVAAMQFLGQGYAKKPLRGLKRGASPDNEQIIRNVTWDVTHVRTFNEQISSDQNSQEHCYVLCTLDVGMQNLADVAWSFATSGDAGRYLTILGTDAVPALDMLRESYGRQSEAGRFATNPNRTSDDSRMVTIALEEAVYGHELNATAWHVLRDSSS